MDDLDPEIDVFGEVVVASDSGVDVLGEVIIASDPEVGVLDEVAGAGDPEVDILDEVGVAAKVERLAGVVQEVLEVAGKGAVRTRAHPSRCAAGVVALELADDHPADDHPADDHLVKLPTAKAAPP